MQNIDFYNGRNIRTIPQQFDRHDPEFFSPYAGQNNLSRDEERKRKKASRMLFLITALCIISFTTGMVLGIKFAGGAEREIVDRDTADAVSGIGKKLTHMLGDDAVTTGDSEQNMYPKKAFPYVIAVGSVYNRETTREIASFLSAKGHTVIISKSGDGFKIYTGPYTAKDEAVKNEEKITGYRESPIPGKLKILKR